MVDPGRSAGVGIRSRWLARTERPVGIRPIGTAIRPITCIRVAEQQTHSSVETYHTLCDRRASPISRPRRRSEPVVGALGDVARIGPVEEDYLTALQTVEDEGWRRPDSGQFCTRALGKAPLLAGEPRLK